MRENFWNKLASIREQPEHIRMRYVFGCVAVSMMFILSIWFLSLKDRFSSLATTPSTLLEAEKEALSETPKTSLNSLLQAGETLQVDGQSKKTGQEYFEEQYRDRAPLSSNESSVVPVQP